MDINDIRAVMTLLADLGREEEHALEVTEGVEVHDIDTGIEYHGPVGVAAAMDAGEASQLMDGVCDLVQLLRDELRRHRGEGGAERFHGRLIHENDDGFAEGFKLLDLPRRLHREPLDHGVEEKHVVDDIPAGLVFERQAGGQRTGDVALDVPYTR